MPWHADLDAARPIGDVCLIRHVLQRHKSGSIQRLDEVVDGKIQDRMGIDLAGLAVFSRGSRIGKVSELRTNMDDLELDVQVAPVIAEAPVNKLPARTAGGCLFHCQE